MDKKVFVEQYARNYTQSDSAVYWAIGGIAGSCAFAAAVVFLLS